MLEPLLGIYNTLILLGMLLSGAHLLQYFAKQTPIPMAFQWLISIGGWMAIISWLGFLGVFRIPYLAQIVGLLWACYALYGQRQIRGVLRSAYEYEPAGAVFVVLILAVCLIPKYCYFYGGFNNTDDVRSIVATVSFAANYLKPAFLFDFSIPLSDGYYSYQLSAFLYAAVGGYHWPSIALIPTSLAAIGFFYAILIIYLKAAFPGHGRYAILIGLLCVTFYGLDIFADPGSAARGHIEWWNLLQLTQMASYHNWVYKYLLAMGFGLAALYSFEHYRKTKHSHWLYATVALTAFAPTFGVITGVWLCGVIALVLILTLCHSPKLIANLLWHTPGAVLIVAIIALPQILTFIGRETFVQLISPVLWFTRVSVADATLMQWWVNVRYFWYEMGLLLLAGLFALPFLGYAALRQKQNFQAMIFCMAIIAFIGASITYTELYDWYWRGCNLLITVCAAVAVVWLYEHLRERTPALVLHAVIGLGLWPGIMNYNMETYFRWNACAPVTDPVAIFINRTVDLHSVFRAEAPIWPRTMILGGRAYYDSTPGGLYSLSKNSPAFLARYFDVPYKQNICDKTRFGSALPNNTMISISKNMIFTTEHCK